MVPVQACWNGAGWPLPRYPVAQTLPVSVSSVSTLFPKEISLWLLFHPLLDEQPWLLVPCSQVDASPPLFFGSLVTQRMCDNRSSSLRHQRRAPSSSRRPWSSRTHHLWPQCLPVSVLSLRLPSDLCCQTPGSLLTLCLVGSSKGRWTPHFNFMVRLQPKLHCERNDFSKVRIKGESVAFSTWGLMFLPFENIWASLKVMFLSGIDFPSISSAFYQNNLKTEENNWNE